MLICWCACAYTAIHFTVAIYITYHLRSPAPYSRHHFVSQKVLHFDKNHHKNISRNIIAFENLCVCCTSALSFKMPMTFWRCINFFKASINRCTDISIAHRTYFVNPSDWQQSSTEVLMHFRNVAVIEQTLEPTKFKVNAHIFQR